MPAIGLPNEAQVAPSMIVETIEEALDAAEVGLENHSMFSCRPLIQSTYVSFLLKDSIIAPHPPLENLIQLT